MYDAMFATPKMEKDFFDSLPHDKEMGGLFFIDPNPVFGGRRLFQRALRRTRSPFFIRSYIVTQNASDKPKTTYCPENWQMLVNIAQQTSSRLHPFVISWHTHPVGGSHRPSMPDFNNWWQLWKISKSKAQGAIVLPHRRSIFFYEFGTVLSGNALNVAKEESHYLIDWGRYDLADVRKLYKANKVN